MIYMEHAEARRAYKKALEDYGAILDEWAALFEKTQPKGQQTDAVRVQTSMTNDTLDNYLAEKQRRNIDARLAEAKAIAENRKALLDNALEALTRSNEPLDKIYKMRFLRGCSVERIAAEMHYSESHIYRLIRWIRKNTKERE